MRSGSPIRPTKFAPKVRNMMTDPQRIKRTDPGRPEICPVFAWHKLFSLPETIAKVDHDCRTAADRLRGLQEADGGKSGDVDRADSDTAQRIRGAPEKVWDILDAGTKKAQKAARRR